MRRACSGVVGVQYILDSRKKEMKDRDSSGIVGVADTTVRKEAAQMPGKPGGTVVPVYDDRRIYAPSLFGRLPGAELPFFRYCRPVPATHMSQLYYELSAALLII